MVSDAVVLMPHQRRVVDECVACHARRRGWTLHAVQCRSQHVHAVVTAPGRAPAAVIVELKVWATRALHAAGDEHSMIKRGRWWTRGGSTRMVFDEAALESVVTYVMECQDRGRGV
jgi:REP element-mobilizing transposase RayT